MQHCSIVFMPHCFVYSVGSTSFNMLACLQPTVPTACVHVHEQFTIATTAVNGIQVQLCVYVYHKHLLGECIPIPKPPTRRLNVPTFIEPTKSAVG